MKDEIANTLEAFYSFLWPPEDDTKKLVEVLDQDVGGRSDDFLLEIAREQGVGSSTLVLDLGSGRGKQSAKLARQLGCKVIALDPVMSNIKQVTKNAENEEVAHLVTPVSGSMEAIPLADASVDFIWIRDSLNHVRDLGAAFREAARVLKPMGRLLNYSAVATAWLEPLETERMCRPMAINPETLSAIKCESAMRDAGFHISMNASTSDEHSKYAEAFSDNVPTDFMRLARLIRARDKFTEQFGEQKYRFLESLYSWRMYWAIGKIEQQLWVLEKLSRQG
jgi:ubiquinone/menaquinone biosynthesis C-methylase UbiE